MGSEWNASTWGELATLEYGKALRGYESGTGEYRVYGTNGAIGWTTTPLWPAPGVIIGRKGAYRGVHYSPNPFFVIDTAFYLKPKQAFDMRWAHYELLTKDINSMDSGSAIPSTSRDEFYNMPVLVPPIEEQRRIANILQSLDLRIDLLKQTAHTLQSIAQTVFHSWFVNFDPVAANTEGRSPEGMSPETASLFPDEFEATGEGLIPKGWRRVPVRELYAQLFDGLHGTPAPSETGPMFLGIKNFTPTSLDFTEIRRISEEDWPQWVKRVTPTPGDIVFTYEATLGYFAVIPPGLRCCLGRRIALVRPKPDWDNGLFLFHAFISKPFQNILIARKNHGSTVDRIPLSDFPNYPILWPGLELSRRFSSAVAPLWERIHTNQAQMETLRELRNTLLPRLISGKLRVPDAKDVVEEALA